MQKPFAETLLPVGIASFTQTLRLWEKPKNILPLPVGHAQTTARKGSQKMTAPKPTRKNKHPRREVRKQARPHSSEETKTHDEEDKQNKKQNPPKLERSRSTQNIKTQTQNRTNPKNAGTRDKLDQKKALHQTPKQRNNNK